METAKITESFNEMEIHNKSCDPLREELTSRLGITRNLQTQKANQTQGTSQPKPISEIFPWLPPFYTKVRLEIKIDHSDQAVLAMLRQYIKCIRDDMHNFIRLPNRCFLLSKNITRMMLFFKLLNKGFTDSDEYLKEICELLSIYTTLELKYSTKFEESKAHAANRISMNYDVHLWGMEERFILKVLLYVRNFFQQREIIRKLLKKYLDRNGPCVIQKELEDDLYVMYLTSYKHWKTLEESLGEKTKVEEVANAFMRPCATLRKNALYAPYIPAFKSKPENATKCILGQNFSVQSLIQAIEQSERTNSVVSHHSIDLVTRYDSLYIDLDPEIEVISLPTVKLEQPEVVATVDLTSESESKWGNDLTWLDTLVDKVRAYNKIKTSTGVVDVIEIDDDDDEKIEESTATKPSGCEIADTEPLECNLEDISTAPTNQLEDISTMSLTETTNSQSTLIMDAKNDPITPLTKEKLFTNDLPITPLTKEKSFTNDDDFPLKPDDEDEALDVAGMEIDFPEKTVPPEVMFLSNNTKMDFAEKSFQSLLSSNIADKDSYEIEKSKYLSRLDQLPSGSIEAEDKSSPSHDSKELDSVDRLSDSNILKDIHVSKNIEEDPCNETDEIIEPNRKILLDSTNKDSWKIILPTPPAEQTDKSLNSTSLESNIETVEAMPCESDKILENSTNNSNCPAFKEIITFTATVSESHSPMPTVCPNKDIDSEAISKMMDISIAETEILLSEYEKLNSDAGERSPKTTPTSDALCETLTNNKDNSEDNSQNRRISNEMSCGLKIIENILLPENASKAVEANNAEKDQEESNQQEIDSLYSSLEAEDIIETSQLESINNFGNLRTYSKRNKKPANDNSSASTPRLIVASQVDAVKPIPQDTQDNTEVFQSTFANQEQLPEDKSVKDISQISASITNNIAEEQEELNKVKSVVIPPDEDDDDIIKNIAKNVINNTKKAVVKNRNDSISYELKLPKIGEGTLLDLPVFSSSEENDDSGDSNILSILDESDNTDERNLDTNEERSHDDDVPVRKISPKARTDECVKRAESNDVVFRMTANTHLPLSTESIFGKPDYSANSTVVFSTSSQRKRTMDTADAVFDTDDSFHIPQPEITSPPIEEFTKSDKTLFKTFLNNVCDETTYEPKRMHSVHDPIIGKSFMKSDIGNQKMSSNKRSSGTCTEQSDINDLINIMPSSQRRKTVSFLDTKDERPHKEDRPLRMHPNLPLSNNQHLNRMGKECWTASINTYRPNTHPVVTSTSFQPRSTFLNTKFQQTVPNSPNPEPRPVHDKLNDDKINDDKIFNAYVYLKRVDSRAYLLENLSNALFLYAENYLKNQKPAVPKKKQSDFEKYFQRKISEASKEFSVLSTPKSTKKRDTTKSRKKTVNKKISFKPNRFNDIKLTKKVVVLLYDIMTDNEKRAILNVKTKESNQSNKNKYNKSPGRSTPMPRQKENVNWALENRTTKRLAETEYTTKRRKSSPKRKPGKSSEFNKKESKPNKRKRQGSSKQKESPYPKHVTGDDSLVGTLNRNFLSSSDVTSSILSFNDVHESYNKRSDFTANQQKQNKENKFQYMGYCINSYSTPINKNKIQTSNTALLKPTQLRKRVTSETFSTQNNAAQYLAGPQFQEDIEDNRVTSTQDSMPTAAGFACPPDYPLMSDVDIQNNYIDTTLEESSLQINNASLENSYLRRKAQAKKVTFVDVSKPRVDSSDLPTTTTVSELQVDACHVDPLRGEQAYTSDNQSGMNIVKDKNVQEVLLNLSSNSDYTNRERPQSRLSDQPVERPEGNIDYSKTYSNLNFTKTIFVPPEIMKIIEADNPFT